MNKKYIAWGVAAALAVAPIGFAQAADVVTQTYVIDSVSKDIWSGAYIGTGTTIAPSDKNPVSPSIYGGVDKRIGGVIVGVEGEVSGLDPVFHSGQVVGRLGTPILDNVAVYGVVGVRTDLNHGNTTGVGGVAARMKLQDNVNFDLQYTRDFNRHELVGDSNRYRAGISFNF